MDIRRRQQEEVSRQRKGAICPAVRRRDHQRGGREELRLGEAVAGSQDGDVGASKPDEEDLQEEDVGGSGNSPTLSISVCLRCIILYFDKNGKRKIDRQAMKKNGNGFANDTYFCGFEIFFSFG